MLYNGEIKNLNNLRRNFEIQVLFAFIMVTIYNQNHILKIPSTNNIKVLTEVVLYQMGDTSKTKMEHADDLVSEGVSDSDDEHDCSTIHLSALGKRRLRKPWEKILIVEVLGHTVGYRFLVGIEIEGRVC